MSFADAAAIYTQRVQSSVTSKRRTKDYQIEIKTAVMQSWPELADKEVRRILPEACLDWATAYAKKFSATRYNASIAFLRHVFDVAIESREELPHLPGASLVLLDAEAQAAAVLFEKSFRLPKRHAQQFADLSPRKVSRAVAVQGEAFQRATTALRPVNVQLPGNRAWHFNR